MRLRNISPMGQLDVPAIGRQGEPFGEPGSGCLEPGEVFEVPAKLAGRAPSESTDPDTGAVTVDLGSGLLAQAGVFELVPEKTNNGRGARS